MQIRLIVHITLIDQGDKYTCSSSFDDECKGKTTYSWDSIKCFVEGTRVLLDIYPEGSKVFIIDGEGNACSSCITTRNDSEKSEDYYLQCLEN